MAIRMVGLATGLDVDAIVKALTTSEQMKVDRMKSQQTLLRWKNDAYSEVKTLVSDFTNKYLSILNPKTSLVTPSAFNVKTVTASSSLYASITANSDAVNGSYTINNITSLASGAKFESNSMEIAIGSSLTDLGITLDEGLVSFSLNDVEFEFSGDESLKAVMAKVNSSDTEVTMSYSSLTGKISLTSKKLGSDTSFNFSDTGGNFVSALGFTEVSQGTDAILKINDIDVVKKSNTFTIDGMTFNLMRTTNTGIEFNISQDTEDSFNRINNFIKDYNKLLLDLTSKLNEKVNSNYAPLTEEQRKDMSEGEIKSWEEKAKAGILKGDSNIKNLISSLRSSFIEGIEGVGSTAYDMGLSTGNWYDKGQIVIDETKLRNAIANKSDALQSLFLKNSSSKVMGTKFKESGIIERFSLTLKNYSTNLTSETIKGITKKIGDFDRTIANLMEKMSRKENHYYLIYANLEKTISGLNSQSDYLNSYFNNSNTSK